MAPSDLRASTGVAGLDVMLGGGLPPGRPYLLCGVAGSGKTLLGLQFLLEGVRVGEKVLLVAVDEPPPEILDNVRPFGWDLSKIHTLDATPGVQVFRRMGNLQEIKSMHDVKSMQEVGDKPNKAQASEDVTLQSIYLKLRRQLDVIPFKRVLIDSMTSVRHYALRAGNDLQIERVEIQSLLRFLSEKGVTTLLTAQPYADLTPEAVLCRGEIDLERGWAGHRTERWISVRRMRGSPHDTQRRAFHIGGEGLSVEGTQEFVKGRSSQAPGTHPD
jgi:KaiC/GvpD/RAD55 family RecA-like ATPase